MSQSIEAWNSVNDDLHDEKLQNKVKVLLKTKFSIFSVNTKFHDYFCPVFSPITIIVHSLDKSILDLFW